MPKKIGIVARGGTGCLAPFQDKSWELWGMPWVHYPRIDVVHEVHTQACWDAAARDPMTEPGALNPDGGPFNPEARRFVSTPCRAHLFPAERTELLDVERIKRDFPLAPLENTICYQMAMAMQQGADIIGLWGVHMNAAKEYIHERAAVHYWIGFAEGRGVEIFLQPGAPLMASCWEAGRYGVSPKKRF